MTVAETTLTQNPLATAPVAAPAAQPVTASVVQPDTQTPASAITAAISGERVYIRVATFHSHVRARRLAAKLKPRDVHIARLIHHGRHYYRVWIETVGLPEEADSELASVRSLGFHDARIIARRDMPRHLARAGATRLATRDR